ncbi:MAG: hypothetical protein ABIK89_18845, partial [Planctomycetota bacterium]
DSPRPELFTSSKVRQASHQSGLSEETVENTDNRPQTEKKSRPMKRLFDKMMGRDDEGKSTSQK